MYKYVEFNSEIYLGCIILCLYCPLISKHMLLIFTYEGQCYYYISGKN